MQHGVPYGTTVAAPVAVYVYSLLYVDASTCKPLISVSNGVYIINESHPDDCLVNMVNKYMNAKLMLLYKHWII